MASVATMGFALLLLWKFQTGFGGFQFLESNRWFASLGVGYIVGVDGFSLFMVVVTAVLFPIGLLASTKRRRAPGQGVHVLVPAARGRDHGDLPLARPRGVLRVLGGDARPDVLPHRGMGQLEPQVRGDEVLHLHGGGLGVPPRRAARARLPPPGRHRRADVRLPGARALGRALRVDRALAVPRLHGRVRDQGAVVPVPHVAPRRAHRGADRRLGGAGRRDPEDGRLRRPALRVRALPARVGVLRAALPHARGDRHRLRLDRRRDAEGREARDRVLVGRAHGLHPPRHLLDHRVRPRRRRVHDGRATRSPPARSSS